MKIIAWNVNGLRSILKKNIYKDMSFEEYITYQNPDILCLSEIKIPHQVDLLNQYKYRYWTHSESRSGVLVLSKIKPISSIGTAGRLIQLEFDKFYLVSVYVQNAGENLKNLDMRNKWDQKMFKYLNMLKSKKEVIYCGDLNVVNYEIDTYNFKQQRNKVAGVTDLERDNFHKLLDSGFIDVYREKYGSQIQYTYFTYLFDARRYNRGMRLDYFLSTENLYDSIKDIKILDNVVGSDHVPVEIILDLKNDKKDIVIRELEKIELLEANKNQIYKARAYRTVIDQLADLSRIEKIEDLNDVAGIGSGIRNKIIKILNDGELDITEYEARNELYDEIIKIYGIGPTRAKELLQYVNSIEELREKPELLNEKQLIGLDYYEDLNLKIPRDEMKLHEVFIKDKLRKVSLKSVEIVGSYRRGKDFSGDIDVLICCGDVIEEVVGELGDYIIETLAIGSKFMGICQLKGYPFRRIDILTTTKESYPFALVYFTGDKNKNLELRRAAKDKGLKLNEKGLFDKNNNLIDLKTENSIFDYLGVERNIL